MVSKPVPQDAGHFRDIQPLVDSMQSRKANFADGPAVAAMKSNVREILRDDAPGSLLNHQLESLCLMDALESGKPSGLSDRFMRLFTVTNRGGLLCTVAGAGKTVIALSHARRKCPENRPIFVLAPQVLLTDVWEPQVKDWLKDSRYKSVKTAQDVHHHLPKHGAEWGGQFILINKDSMILDESTWRKLQRLDPAYIFVDEGGALASENNTLSKMVEAMKATTTVTWVIAASPFKESNATMSFQDQLMSALPCYDAITQPRQKGSLSVRLKKSQETFGDSISTIDKVYKNKMDFVISHSSKELGDLIPEVKFQSRIVGDEDSHRTNFLAVLKRECKNKTKVLVAGMTKTQRETLYSILSENGIRYSCMDKDKHAAVKMFAQSSDTFVFLMSDNVKDGIDSLKVAQKVLFWSEKHADFSKPHTQETIIKRIARLGCEHKKVVAMSWVVGDDEDEADEPPAKRARTSGSSAASS